MIINYKLKPVFYMKNPIRKNRKYVSPRIQVTEVIMEESFANTSSTIEYGGPSNEPKVEEWEIDSGGKYKNFDL